ncbi:MAG: DNA gyrase/topoisomerase IV subunit B [Candidatus Xenobium sp.]|jgi:DNA gyrase/topoisomerase IV subunit B|nr:type IIA DNA topoisomerase subunit B [Burkholderiales bacterium]
MSQRIEQFQLEFDLESAVETVPPVPQPLPASPAAREEPETEKAPPRSRRKKSEETPTGGYRARDIQVLTGLEPVRKRPGLYVGSVDEAGLHHLVWEIVDNSIDEVMNGYATFVELELDADGQGIRVTDNGRGIPVDLHEKYKKPALELILTTLHAGGKFASSNYQYSGGLHGVGASVVNALSHTLEATIRRDGREWFQAFRRGKPVGPLQDMGTARGTGTSIWFRPDPEIFQTTVFDGKVILETMEARAWLHRMKVVFKDRTSGETHRLDHTSEGLDGYLVQLVGKEPRAEGWETVFTYGRDDDPKLELALLWSASGGEQVRSFVNGVRTPQGGTHDLGLKAGVVRAVRNYMDTHGLQPRGLKLSAEDIRDGLRGVLSIYVREPQFKGQTKERLNNPEVNAQVANALAPALESFLNENRSVAQALVDRVVSGARSRAEIQAATEMVARKSVSHRLNLPGKLADCSSTRPGDSELFIVEGDSAGGSAKQARDRRHQAILPLRGKILNTEQAGMGKMGQNKEIADLLSALGCGIGPKFDRDRLRYGRVVILTDADSDGHHIAGLLITFFYRFLPELVRKGHIYLGRPPLYRVQIGKETHWAWDDEQRDRIMKRTRSRANPVITRFKGLGEMSPAQLKETTLDPRSRTLFRVCVTDEEEADKAISECFGRDPAPRYRFVMECATQADELDV